MKEIIKKGKGKTRLDIKNETKYLKKCWNCGCEFTYQIKDIYMNWCGEENTICPCCEISLPVPLIFKKKYRGK